MRFVKEDLLYYPALILASASLYATTQAIALKETGYDLYNNNQSASVNKYLKVEKGLSKLYENPKGFDIGLYALLKKEESELSKEDEVRDFIEKTSYMEAIFWEDILLTVGMFPFALILTIFHTRYGNIRDRKDLEAKLKISK